jgi:hypothetical protein
MDAFLNQCERDLRAWNGSNDRVIEDMLTTFDSFNSIPVLKKVAEKCQGSVATDHESKVTITRSHFLTNSVPWNLVRVKTQLAAPLDSPPLSSGIEVISRDSHFQVEISIANGAMAIKGERYSRSIQLNDVSELIVIQDSVDSSILITACHIPTLLCAHAKNALTSRADFGMRMFPHLKLDASAIDHRVNCISTLRSKWVRGHISTFKYLSLLNALSGRTYENFYESYPLFPSVAVLDFTTCASNFFFSLDGSFIDGESESRPLPAALLVMPEYYFLAAGGRSPASVYQNRKALEVRDDVHVWVGLASLPDLPHPLPFSDGAHPARAPCSRPEMRPTTLQLTHGERIHYCGSMKTASAERFGYVTSSGSVHVIALSHKSDEWILASNEKWPVGFDVAKDGTFSNTREELMRINRRTFAVVHATAASVQTALSLASAETSEDCCQPAPTELAIFHIGRVVTLRFFTSLSAKILCFARSRKFNITAVGCQDSMVRIRSNESGLKVATVSLADDIPRRILITKGWGFVVVDTIVSFFVLTVNGVIVRKGDNRDGWSRWFTFRTRDDCDFIALSMDDGTLRYFEAAEDGTDVLLPVRGPACAWTYAWRQDCFCIVLDRGELAIVPRRVAENGWGPI